MRITRQTGRIAIGGSEAISMASTFFGDSGDSAHGKGSNAPGVITLGDLSNRLKALVEGNFERVRVKAEISRPTRATSGHVYFTLKDENHTLDAVCWRSSVGRLDVQPEEGLEVVATGRLTTYSGRSKYQIVIDALEIAGEGAMLRQLEERRRKLAGEGLFDEERKLPMPQMPAVIGVVTSPTGAVIRDILHRLTDRFGVHVLVWGSLMQGKAAAGQVARAVRGFDAITGSGGLPRPDLVIVARGGGSLEDLWAFNEEEVVRAVAECSIPVISAIGHESDTTLIDHAADLRAPTPSAAAELAVPVHAALAAQLADCEDRLASAVVNGVDRMQSRLDWVARSIPQPVHTVERKAQALDLAVAELGARLDMKLGDAELLLAMAGARIATPSSHIARGEARIDIAGDALTRCTGAVMAGGSIRLVQSARLLEAHSFERVLERGFALVTSGDGKPVRRAAGLRDGQDVLIRFADASRRARLGAGDAKG